MFGLLLDELLGRFVPRGDAGFCPSGGAQMMTQVAQATAASQLDTGFHRIVDVQYRLQMEEELPSAGLLGAQSVAPL